ncbi:hypothetical protein [Salmonella enterica]|uniref:hypothetical protein n=1 Tax=Salmonella enterica TaxID=28901 RepID=UPI001079BD43|nr:hypothetical protein [Salmonella enterica]EHQ9197633.1 hypothetical protein [Salmonella enterica subsp. diarizonae serovar 50:k:z:[z50],[z57],[z68], [z86]]EAA0681881.1 hypothetical protein [Salmonella enterica subsp. diarizonae]EAN5460138.1 hypothetical protein [Salmonella enterica]EAS3781505.1 hypothetical protein [Salmonella enterica]EBI8903173.1 hypothetical protein [Salmonella enterica]
MSEKLIKESRKVFIHMASLFYEMKINTLKEIRPDEVEMLMKDDAFMDSIYKDCIKNVSSSFKKVVRAEYFEVGHSVKMVDKVVVLMTLRVNHKKRLGII